MKKLKRAKPSSLNNHLRQAFLLATMFSVLIAEHLHAQPPKIYKIAVYEYNCRGEVDAQHHHYKYEIRNLFKKVDTGWVINNSNRSEVYRRVYRGALLITIKGYPSPDSSSDLADNIEETMLTPVHPVSLTESYFSKQFKNDDPGLVKKASLLSNNASFKQNTKLAPYVPSPKEKKWLLDTTKSYMTNLFRFNKACIEHAYTDLDSIIKYVVQNKEIFIDSLNSFIDNKGNKIINILLPARTLWSGVYPFDKDCFREDDGFNYYRIMCYIQNNGNLFFLRDELKYLDHGDFDNDGKDEFLFWTSRYNHDGYIMYYDNFKKSVSYTWRYN